MKWTNVKDKLPKHGNGSFLAYWENQSPLMLVCFVNIHGVYIMAGSNGENSCGHGDHPKFSHWRPLPIPPNQSLDNIENLAKDQKDLPPEFSRVADKHFWDLV